MLALCEARLSYVRTLQPPSCKVPATWAVYT